MKGFAILLLIVTFFCFAWPYISRWLKRKAIERTEDYILKSMGMPPRHKKTKKHNFSNGTYGKEQNDYQQRRKYRKPTGPIIPPEYAEDVEFVEYIDYSGIEYIQRISRHIEIYFESQISDAEWSEIKKPRS